MGHTDPVASFAALGLLMVFGAIAFAVYFLPSWIAHSRNKANIGAIFALNFLAGWTFIGWVVALVWALTVEEKQ